MSSTEGSDSSQFIRSRPRAKSAPNIVEQQVALCLRSISDDLNESYSKGNEQTDRNRRASYPTFAYQQFLSVPKINRDLKSAGSSPQLNDQKDTGDFVIHETKHQSDIQQNIRVDISDVKFDCADEEEENEQEFTSKKKFKKA